MRTGYNSPIGSLSNWTLAESSVAQRISFCCAEWGRKGRVMNGVVLHTGGVKEYPMLPYLISPGISLN